MKDSSRRPYTEGRRFFRPLQALSISLLLCLACSSAWALPKASFSQSKTSGCSPLNVQFNNTSTGATSYYWDFGNGNTSTLFNPANLYTIAGSYAVKLIAFDALGNKDSVSVTNLITVIGNPTASFYATSTSSCFDNNLISFVSTSTGAATWLWDFGDGTFSSLQNPAHSYPSPGTYSIKLMVNNSSGCSDIYIMNQYIVIYPKPKATFTVNSTVACGTTQPVSFTSTSSNAVSYNWNFGDGTTSSQQNPSHNYSAAGTYSANLIVTDIHGCSDTSKAPVSIDVISNNWATFSSNINSGCAPLLVIFKCGVSNPVSVLWNFGNGKTSNLINPTHTYASGTFTVSMTVTNTNGCTNTITIPNYIVTTPKPTVSFTLSDSTGCSPFPVQFTSNCQNVISYKWNFGDGSAYDTIPNPLHVFAGTGVFNVSLRGTGASGCYADLAKIKAVSISKDVASFSASPRISCAPMTVNFTNSSQGNKLTYFWKFGDGSTSTQKNPFHTYSNNGSFDVTLIVKDSAGCTDTLFKPGYIQASNPSANYITPDTLVTCTPLTTQFQDNTSGAVSWFWNFGDGTTSTLQNPLHTYSVPGLYTVSLTSVLSGGCAQTINAFRVFDVKGGVAKFSVQQTQCPPYCASFIDSSSNAVAWLWNFGDGTTSTLQNPTHCYASAGWYSVSLTITTPDGCNVSTMYSNCVYFQPFQANFYGIPANSGFPQTINFYANSVGATGWLWDFGDGGTSTDENPIHTYTGPGNYSISLTITLGPCTLKYDPPPFTAGSGDSLVFNPTVIVPPQTQKGCAPFFVTFNNNDPTFVSWLWDFGDGTTDSVANTYHIYNDAGIFNVKLTTIDTAGVTHVEVMDSLVRVSSPVAKFSYLQGANCSNTLIAFKDSSRNANYWLWDFGDGTTDTSKSPTHLFSGQNNNYVVSLTVSDTAGCSSSLSTSIYSSYVSPIILSQSEVCNSDSVIFNTSLQNYSSYLWVFGDSTTSNDLTPTHTYSSTGIYNVTLTVTDNGGCTQTFSMPAAVTVTAPVPNFISSGKLTNCLTTSVKFINTSTGADYYWWDFGDSTGSNVINPYHVYSSPGNYTVTLTAYSGNCSATLVKTNYVNVYKAHADFQVTPNGLCLPMTIQFTDLSTDAVKWDWSLGDGTKSSQQNPVNTYYSAPFLSYRLIITDSHGCIDSTSHVPTSVLHNSFTASADTGCIPFNVTFTNQCVMATSFYWDFGDGTTSTQPNPKHVYSKNGSYDVTLIITSSGNCVDTLTMPHLINVLNPHADFTSPDLTACAPSVVNFTDLSQDAITWLWDFGDGTTSTNKNPSHIYNVPGKYDVKLVVGTNRGCSDSLIKTDYINVLGPVTQFTVSATDGCSPFTVQFSDQSQNAVDWIWNFGDGYSSTSVNPSHTYSDTGSFTVALITHDSSGCSSFYSYPQKISVHGVPHSAFSTNDTVGCQPLIVTLNNLSTGQDSSWWDFGDGTVSTQVNPTHIYTDPGAYTVTLISKTQFGCSDTVRMNSPILVNMTPDVSFSSVTTGGCSPLFVSFTDSSVNLLNPSYSWTFSDGQSSASANPEMTFVNPGFYDASLTVTNSNGCRDSLSMSNLIHVLDTISPPVSPIYSVSVTSNSTVEIIWENNSAIDLGSYQLYRYNPTTLQWENIFTDLNPNNSSFSLTSSYMDHSLNTLSNTYSYKLLTTDVCGYNIGLDQLTAHTTINISAKAQGENVRLSWTPYQGCSVSGYSLYRADPGATPQFIASVPSDSLSYTDTTLHCPYSFSYEVRANDLGGRSYISNSDTSMATPDNNLASQVVDMTRATVVDNKFVLAEWKEPLIHLENVVQYDVYRSIDNVNFTYIASVPSVQTDYADYNVDVQNISYYYKVLVVNQCDIDGRPSEVSSSVLLSGEVSDDYVYRLHWTDYKNWTNGVDRYIIERQNPDGTWTKVGIVDGTSTKFEER